MLKEAEEAVYDKASLARGITADRRQRFFSPKDDKWAVRPEVKSSVTIKELNLLNSYSALGKSLCYGKWKSGLRPFYRNL